MYRAALTTVAVLALLVVAAASPAAAQCNLSRWTEPVACQVELELHGGGSVEGDTLHLPADQTVELHAAPLDQRGRAFPADRFRFEFDFDRDCNGVVELAGASDQGVTLRTGRGAGSCDVLLWIPGNMNLDRELRVEVGRTRAPQAALRPGGGDQTGAIDTRQELVAASLFRGIMGREPDRRWLDSAAEQVRQGETRDQIESLLRSPEFNQRRRSVPPDEILRDFYQGLLGRAPDQAGARTYLGDIRDGDYEEVILDILGSDEFDQRVERELR